MKTNEACRKAGKSVCVCVEINVKSESMYTRPVGDCWRWVERTSNALEIKGSSAAATTTTITIEQAQQRIASTYK